MHVACYRPGGVYRDLPDRMPKCEVIIIRFARITSESVESIFAEPYPEMIFRHFGYQYSYRSHAIGVPVFADAPPELKLE